MRSVNDGFVREPVYVLPSPLTPLELKAPKVASQAPLNAKVFRVFRVWGLRALAVALEVAAAAAVVRSGSEQ